MTFVMRTLPALSLFGNSGLDSKNRKTSVCERNRPEAKPFEGFFNDRCHRLVAHQQLAVRSVTLAAVADRRVKDVVAFLDAGGHLLDDLAAVLLPL